MMLNITIDEAAFRNGRSASLSSPAGNKPEGEGNAARFILGAVSDFFWATARWRVIMIAEFSTSYWPNMKEKCEVVRDGKTMTEELSGSPSTSLGPLGGMASTPVLLLPLAK